MTRWLHALLALVGVCTHEHRYWQRGDDRRLLLVCERCGDRVDAFTRAPTFMRSGADAGVRHATALEEHL